MIINNNISSIFANRQLANNGLNLDRSMEKLSSGLRINKAADDASGLAVSEKMRSQVRGLSAAMRNIQDGISFLQTTEGYLEETTSILQRMRELSVQAGNGIYSDTDRAMIQVEVDQLVQEIDRIADHAQFNGLNMLTGAFAAADANTDTAGNGLSLHIGPNMDQNITMTIGDMRAAALGIRDGDGISTVNVATAESANTSLGLVDTALMSVVRQRADIGAFQSRLNEMMRGQYVAYENMQASESRIRDTNMATQMSDYVKDQILSQSAVSILAQANAKSQMVLRLLQ